MSVVLVASPLIFNRNKLITLISTESFSKILRIFYILIAL